MYSRISQIQIYAYLGFYKVFSQKVIVQYHNTKNAKNCFNGSNIKLFDWPRRVNYVNKLNIEWYAMINFLISFTWDIHAFYTLRKIYIHGNYILIITTKTSYKQAEPFCEMDLILHEAAYIKYEFYTLRSLSSTSYILNYDISTAIRTDITGMTQKNRSYEV